MPSCRDQQAPLMSSSCFSDSTNLVVVKIVITHSCVRVYTMYCCTNLLYRGIVQICNIYDEVLYTYMHRCILYVLYTANTWPAAVSMVVMRCSLCVWSQLFVSNLPCTMLHIIKCIPHLMDPLPDNVVGCSLQFQFTLQSIQTWHSYQFCLSFYNARVPVYTGAHDGTLAAGMWFCAFYSELVSNAR